MPASLHQRVSEVKAILAESRRAEHESNRPEAERLNQAAVALVVFARRHHKITPLRRLLLPDPHFTPEQNSLVEAAILQKGQRGKRPKCKRRKK